MDTERDENQNLRSDIDKSQNNSEGVSGTEESLNENRYDTESSKEEKPEEHDYADDQNNSNTGYTEKLLEKESELIQKKKEADTEYEVDIENDLFVKNGNILDDESEDEEETLQKDKE